MHKAYYILANLNKRFKVSAAIYNLSQLMRKLFGVGTPKQWAAMGKALVLVGRTMLVVVGGLLRMGKTNPPERQSSLYERTRFRLARWVTNGTTGTLGRISPSFKKIIISTGC